MTLANESLSLSLSLHLKQVLFGANEALDVAAHLHDPDAVGTAGAAGVADAADAASSSSRLGLCLDFNGFVDSLLYCARELGG